MYPVLQVFVGLGNSRSAVRAGPLCWRFLSDLSLCILVFGVYEGFPTEGVGQVLLLMFMDGIV